MSCERTENNSVIVIDATNRPDSLDAVLRRAGRFDHEISKGVPDEDARNESVFPLLAPSVRSVHSHVQIMIPPGLWAKLRLEGGFDYASLAKRRRDTSARICRH